MFVGVGARRIRDLFQEARMVKLAGHKEIKLPNRRFFQGDTFGPSHTVASY